MKYSYEITRDDFVNFSKFYYFKTRFKKNIITYVVIIILVQYYLNRNQFDLKATIISVVGIVIAIVLSFYIAFNRVKQLPSENGTILGLRTIELTENEITCTTDSSSSMVNWSKVRSLEKDDKYYYLFLDTNSAYIIPKHVFANQNEESTFIEFVKSKIKTTA